ncbi:DUF2218 domain-containing protein [Rhizohabitans arisaemae]|uniref:DUF2218 domain-containing protein n=1 Tax=Rhizohabitans arisaemae TaxID=2720610 RepID=UPI0024B06365|nr:DUF2218 domain-containing protein [Rhizohabitans arisaemae]
MFNSTATVVTDAPARYAKQLAAHLGRKLTVEDTETGRRLVFEGGAGFLEPGTDRLVMRAVAENADTLAVIEDVLGRHLERFGQRSELTVTWERA